MNIEIPARKQLAFVDNDPTFKCFAVLDKINHIIDFVEEIMGGTALETESEYIFYYNNDQSIEEKIIILKYNGLVGSISCPYSENALLRQCVSQKLMFVVDSVHLEVDSLCKESQEEKVLIFPHSIGNITFYTKTELTNWVEEQQKLLNKINNSNNWGAKQQKKLLEKLFGSN